MLNPEVPIDRGPLRDERRRVADVDRVWTVYEYRIGSAPPSLIFETTDTIRRVLAFPVSWAALTDAELLAICHGRAQRSR